MVLENAIIWCDEIFVKLKMAVLDALAIAHITKIHLITVNMSIVSVSFFNFKKT